MKDKLQEIERLRKTISQYKPLDYEELKRINEDFAVDYTYNSNAIEGNTITLDETYLILKEKITICGKSLNDHLDLINHKEAYGYILELAKTDDELTLFELKNIHYLVLNNNKSYRGVFRNIMVRVGSHTPIEPQYVNEEITKLIDDYNNSDKSLEEIAKFHVNFERIHPFVDGNGRTGRLIMNLQLMKENYLPINIKYKDLDKYYEIFKDYSKNHSYEKVINLVIDYELKELKERLELLKSREISIKKNKGRSR